METDFNIEKLAKLAHLELSEQESEIYSDQIKAILEYADQINELDTDLISETLSLNLSKNRFRADEVSDYEADVVSELKNVDNFKDNYFISKKVL